MEAASRENSIMPMITNGIVILPIKNEKHGTKA